MKQVVIVLCWLMPFMAKAQIKFSTASNWNAVLAQAKKEQKSIFLDAVASWCAPCKRMDDEVYSDPEISDYVNSNFIPLQVQFDQAKNDPQTFKNWYADAKMLMAKYSITAYPTFLFIDGDGKVIEKGIGFQPAAEFLALLKKVNDPNTSYAVQIAKYQAGKIQGQQLMTLAIRAQKLLDTVLANQVAKRYHITVLEKEDPAALLNLELRDFIVDFQTLFSLNDRLIKYLYTHQAEVDAKLDYKNFAQKVMDYLINRDLILPIIEPKGVHQSNTPDWKALNKKIRKAYDVKTADRLIYNTQIDWYKEEKDWPNVVKYTIAQLEAEKLDTVGILARSNLNNISFNLIFTHSDDPVTLKKAIGYMELILPHNPEMHTWIDTYANLLYKIGQKEKAILFESKALKQAKESKYPANIKEYELTLQKMKNNEPTWITEQQ